jgi:hypothetical protein
MPEINLTKAEIEAALRDMKRATAGLDLVASRASDNLLAAYARAEADIYRRLLELSADLPANLRNVPLANKLQWYVSTSASLRNSAELIGVADGLGAYISEYDTIARYAERILAAGMTPPEFTAIPQRLIEALKTQDWSYFEGLNRQAILRLDQALFDSVIAGATKRTMLAELKGVITGSYPWKSGRGLYEWHAGTYVRTMNMRAGRAMVAGQAKEAGLTWYVYIGPADSKTRPFCLDYVGTALDEQEIESLDNGQTGNVLIDGGGYNCRHQWNPVSDALGKSIREDISADEALALVA